MTIQSAPGAGSRFQVTVPLGRVWDAEPRFVPSDELEGAAVLVVDDNATSRTALATLLDTWGMVATVAEDGVSALDLAGVAVAEGRPFSVALVDAAMPGMDGAEVASRMGSDPRTAAIPVVLLATRRSLEAATTGRRGVARAV